MFFQICMTQKAAGGNISKRIREKTKYTIILQANGQIFENFLTRIVAC